MPNEAPRELERLSSWLRSNNACSDAVEWLQRQTSIEQAWRECEHGHWMAWLVGKLIGGLRPESEERRKLTLAGCKFARLSLCYVEENEARPERAIELAELWARGDKRVSIHGLQAAASAADAADGADAASAVLKQCAIIMRGSYPTIRPLLEARMDNFCEVTHAE